jgi:hypothetical protein
MDLIRHVIAEWDRAVASDNPAASVAELLASTTVDYFSNSAFVIQHVAAAGHATALRLLLADPRSDPAICSNVVQTVVRAGHTDALRVLLEDPRVDPAAWCNAAVRVAAWHGHHNVLTALIADPRVDPAARGNEAVRTAAARVHVDALRVLLTDPRVAVPTHVGTTAFGIEPRLLQGRAVVETAARWRARAPWLRASCVHPPAR